MKTIFISNMNCLKSKLINHALIILLLSYCIQLSSQWIQQGPAPSKNGQSENIIDNEVSGAVNCVTPHPSNADVLYIGAVNGGIWKTINATASSPIWNFISEGLLSLAIGALEFDPTDASMQTLVAGNGRTSSFSGIGSGIRSVYRTTNGGTSWTNLDASSIFSNINIRGIIARGATIVVATSSGMFRTTNTGSTWTNISGLAGTGLPNGSPNDLISDPSNINILYTNAGTAGIFKSLDQGATWIKVSNAAIDTDLTGGGFTNLELACGNSNNVFLAIVTNSRLSDIYRSGDGGSTWTSLDIPTTTERGVAFGIHPGGQGGTHLSLSADPSNSSVVYIGGDRQISPREVDNAPPSWPNSLGANDFSGRLFRVDASLPVGSQFTSITHNGTSNNSSPHADSRDMDFDANGDLLEGDDGGIYRQNSPINTTGLWTSLLGNLNITEAHSSDYDAVSKIVINGLQDNGSTQQENSGGTKWSNVNGGDGGDVAVDDVSSLISSNRYSGSQNLGSFRKRTYNTSNALTSIVTPALINNANGVGLKAPGSGISFNFVTPIKTNSINGSKLLIATSSGLFESSDQGATVDLRSSSTINNFGRDAIAYGAVGNSDIIYAGVGSTIHIRAGAPPATLTQATTYPGVSNVQGVSLDPDDGASAYVIDATNVFETSNTGSTWSNITGNLLALNPGSFRTIAYIPNSTDDILAVGTDNGVYISSGPTFNAWSRLGTNLPNCIVLDLEFDTKDRILLASTMGRGSWTFNFSERDPVDLALVLDFSGSMLNNACPTCSPKIDVLKDASEIFVQLWKTLAVGNDRIGSIYFRTNINEFVDGGQIMHSVIDKSQLIIDDIRSQSTTGSQLTALGGGLQQGINQLNDATRPRSVILFTDGMQNVDPGIDYSTMDIRNDLFGPNSNINPTVPPTRLNAALGIKVHTIGVGATSAFETQLAQISSSTNALTKITTSPDEELRRFFVEELVEALRQFSPQLITYRTSTIGSGDTKSERVNINKFSNKVIFKISHSRNDKPIINIFKGKQNVTKMAEIINGSFYTIFVYPLDKLNVLEDDAQFPGDWSVKLKSDNNMRYELAVIADDHTLDYNFDLDKQIYKVGEKIKLKTSILLSNKKINNNFQVQALVNRPVLSLGNVLSTLKLKEHKATVLEPGLPIGFIKYHNLIQQKEFIDKAKPKVENVNFVNNTAGDFITELNEINIPGVYNINFFIEGSHPKLGKIERVENRSIVVSIGNLNQAKTHISLKKKKFGNQEYKYQWTIKPIDEYGNLLGPDFADMLRFSITNGKLNRITDRGNGEYIIEFFATRIGTPKIRLSFMQDVWFDKIP